MYPREGSDIESDVAAGDIFSNKVETHGKALNQTKYNLPLIYRCEVCIPGKFSVY